MQSMLITLSPFTEIWPPIREQQSGVERLSYDLSGEKLTMAENITRNLEALGFRNLGVEARPHLAVLRRTKTPALLIEVGFLDSESDNTPL